jgi:sugar lactone lactonase YvrE
VISTYADLSGVLDTINGVAVRPNGEVLILEQRGTTTTRLLRLNPDGTTVELARGSDCPLQLPPQHGLTFCWAGAPAAGPDGTLYAASTYDHRIWRVTTDNQIGVFAGNGFSGFSGDGGPATNATLGQLHGIGVDEEGNVYFGDGQRIRKVDTNGIITTVAGNGISGYSGDGGPATQARIRRAADIDFDSVGNLYFADKDNNRVRMVDTNGIITTVAGTGVRANSGDGGPAVEADMGHPYSLAVSEDDTVFIAHEFRRIRAVDTAGIIDAAAGTGNDGYTGDGGPATEADIAPQSLVMHPNGDLYFVQGRTAIRKITWHGIVSGRVTAAGVPAAGVTVTLMHDWPAGTVAATTTTDATGAYRFDGLDPGNYRLRFCDPQGRYQPRWFDTARTYRTATPVEVAIGSDLTADQDLALWPARRPRQDPPAGAGCLP